MIDSRRRLPHWVPDSVPVFVTWRLAGTLPHRVRKTQDRLLSGGQRFACADGDLDRATAGPAWLKDGRVAQMVVDALQYGSVVRAFYHLHAYVVMPNHVHVV
jgi:hypothetical protein